MTCIVKKRHLKVLFKEMQFVAFFIFHMEKTRMQVKNDLRCLRQKTSVIDYSISTVDTFKFIDDFEVTKLDSHSLLRSTLKFQNIKRTPQTPSQNTTNKNQPKWKETKKTEFISNLDDDKISLMQTQLQQQAQINIAEMNKVRVVGLDSCWHDFCFGAER